MLEQLVGGEQLLYGSDRPVVEPGELGMPQALDWDPIADGTRRALGADGDGARMSPRANSPRAFRRTHAVLPAAPGRDPGPLSWVPRPRGRDLSGPELEAFVAELADRPELWIDLVKHDSSQRVYEELLSDDHVTAWLICWMDDHDTGFHDHDVSAGAVAVVSGAVREERLTIDGPPRDRSFAAGDTFHFSPADIHRVRHAGR